MLVKSVEDLLQISLVLFCIVAFNEYIIKVNQNEIINVIRHYCIHKMLESRWCIIQSKQKYSLFKQPIPGDESSLFTSIVSQFDLVVATSQVDCRQIAGLRQLVQQVINERQWKDILLHLSVQCSIVNHHSQFPSLFLNEENGGPIG